MKEKPHPPMDPVLEECYSFVSFDLEIDENARARKEKKYNGHFA